MYYRIHVADVDFCRGLLAIACLASRSVDMQMWPSLFTHEKSISPLSNNTNCSNCISIVSNRMQSEILKLPLGNSSIQILRDRSWRWAFATSFPGNCACKTSWVPHISRATLFNGRDSVMSRKQNGFLELASCRNKRLKNYKMYCLAVIFGLEVIAKTDSKRLAYNFSLQQLEQGTLNTIV